MPWAVKLCSEHFERTKDFSPEGIKIARREHTRVKEEAGTLGTAVHLWIEQYIERAQGLRTEITATCDITGFNNCIRAFERFVAERSPTFLESEIMFFHLIDGDESKPVAGRADGKWLIDGVKRIFDIKTSSDLYAEYVGQVAAYEKANFLEHGERLGGSLLWLDKKAGGYTLLNLTQEELDLGYEMFKSQYNVKTTYELFEKRIKKG